MGNRQDLVEIRSQTRSRPVRRSMGGSMEQHDAGRDQDAKTGYDGPEGFPGGSSDHEETSTSEADPIVRRLHDGGADLHHHGIDEERLPAGIPPG